VDACGAGTLVWHGTPGTHGLSELGFPFPFLRFFTFMAPLLFFIGLCLGFLSVRMRFEVKVDVVMLEERDIVPVFS